MDSKEKGTSEAETKNVSPPNSPILVVMGNASQPRSEVSFDVPRGACDCLTHIYGDLGRFPMSANRTYTPELASIAEVERLHKALHVDRVIIVQPTIYGTDNACTIDATRQVGNRARGIAVLDESVSSRLLDEMNESGIRGVRINLETVGLTDPKIARERLIAAMSQVKGRQGWHIQIYTRLAIIKSVADLLERCPVPIAFDHFAGAKAGEGINSRAFEFLLSLLRSGKAYVKLSAPYLASTLAPNFADLDELANAYISANREQVLWGTNWPHPNAGRGENRHPAEVIPLRRVDDGHILNLLPRWAPDPTDRQRILVDNAARLYGF